MGVCWSGETCGCGMGVECACMLVWGASDGLEGDGGVCWCGERCGPCVGAGMGEWVRVRSVGAYWCGEWAMVWNRRGV